MHPNTGLPYQVITYVTHEPHGPHGGQAAHSGHGPGRQRVAVDQRVNPCSALCGAVHHLLDIRMLLMEPRAHDPDAAVPGQYWCEWLLAPAAGEPDRAYLDNRTGAIILYLAAGARHWQDARTGRSQARD